MFSPVSNLVMAVTPIVKVLNDIASVLDCKQHRAAIFINIAKAFDTVNHFILSDRLDSQ